MRVTPKMLGDAGEHYAVSQFTFSGHPSMKMPDGWTGYDLAVESGNGLVRVSVKTRSESPSWSASSWFGLDESIPFDWLVCVFQPGQGPARGWVIPYDIARKAATDFEPTQGKPLLRRISWAKLNRAPLACYEANWKLKRKPDAPGNG